VIQKRDGKTQLKEKAEIDLPITVISRVTGTYIQGHQKAGSRHKRCTCITDAEIMIVSKVRERNVRTRVNGHDEGVYGYHRLNSKQRRCVGLHEVEERSY